MFELASRTLTLRRSIAVAAVLAASLAGSTVGLMHHPAADDIISQLGLDSYASQLASWGITFLPSTNLDHISQAEALATCGSNIPTMVPKAAAYVHVHVTGFGWGPVGSLDQDAWVFVIDPYAMQGPAGQNGTTVPSLSPGHPFPTGSKASFVLWFEGIPDPSGQPCWGFSMAPPAT
jgi:hypothetical protein